MTERLNSNGEWPTVALMVFCYGCWALATTVLAQIWMPGAIVLAAFAIALQSSLQHEIIHGHPFRNGFANAALVFPSLNLCIPFGRFRDQHLAHHNDAILTDPYDDPESNYLDPAMWDSLTAPFQVLLRFNNTLLGRMIVGPMVSQLAFMKQDWRAILAGDRRVLNAWLLHGPAVLLVMVWILEVSAMPLWAYLLAAYLGLSLLKIRTFLEHQAHQHASGRTVVVEDRGPLAFLFLNNNFHVVHHMHPTVPWFRLPALYFANKERYLSRNGGYRYTSYGVVFRRHFLRAKDKVPHPLWRA